MKNKQTGSFYNNSNSHPDDIDKPKCKTCGCSGIVKRCEYCQHGEVCSQTCGYRYKTGSFVGEIKCPDCQPEQSEEDKIRDAFEKDRGISSFIKWSTISNRYTLTDDAIPKYHEHWVDVAMGGLDFYRSGYKSRQSGIDAKDKQISDQVVTINKLLEEIDNWRLKAQ